MKEENKTKCSNCGAPITTEICPYCQNATGINTAEAYMEYPVIDCKEATLNFWKVGFPLIFAGSFGFFGIAFPIFFMLQAPEDALSVALMCSIFVVIGIVALIIALKNIIRYNIAKTKGKEIYATVYGYMDDNLLINGMPAQIVKLKLDTNEGPKFILYQLGDTKQPYKVNGKLKVLVYKNIFMVKKDEKYYFE